jgi:predicted nuclease of predicted toxin-antitoxin system
VRLLLDVHASGRRIGAPLRSSGHEVRAADEEDEVRTYPDEALLALAASEQRILVTFDVADFVEISRKWAEERRSHAGLAIVVGLRHNEFGAVIRAIEATLAEHHDRMAWRDVTRFVIRRTQGRSR